MVGNTSGTLRGEQSRQSNEDSDHGGTEQKKRRPSKDRSGSISAANVSRGVLVL